MFLCSATYTIQTIHFICVKQQLRTSSFLSWSCGWGKLTIWRPIISWSLLAAKDQTTWIMPLSPMDLFKVAFGRCHGHHGMILARQKQQKKNARFLGRDAALIQLISPSSLPTKMRRSFKPNLMASTGGQRKCGLDGQWIAMWSLEEKVWWLTSMNLEMLSSYG